MLSLSSLSSLHRDQNITLEPVREFPAGDFMLLLSGMLCLEMLGCTLPLEKHLPLIRDVLLLSFPSAQGCSATSVVIFCLERGYPKHFRDLQDLSGDCCC